MNLPGRSSWGFVFYLKTVFPYDLSMVCVQLLRIFLDFQGNISVRVSELLTHNKNRKITGGCMMLDITNQNGVTYDPSYTFMLTDMNGQTRNYREYDINNMNGYTWEDTTILSIINMNPLPPTGAF